MDMRVEQKELWGSYVISIRKKHNLSQENLAERLGTNQATISRWERGISTPTYRMQKRMVSLFGNPNSSKIDRVAISSVAQGFVDSIHGYGAVIFDALPAG